jgi:O-antigen ligase
VDYKYLNNGNIVEKIKDFLFLSFAFLLPISQKASTINIALLLLLSLFTLKKNNIQYFKELLVPIIFYLVCCLSLIYSSEFQISIIEKKASLIVFPLIFIINSSFRTHFYTALKYFVVGCVFALFICELNALFDSFDFSRLNFNSKSNEELSLFDSIIKNENAFFSYKFSFLHQTVYFSMYLTFAMAILMYFNFFRKNLQRVFYLFMVIGLFQISNKAGYFVFVILLCVKLFQSVKSKKRILIGMFSLLGACLFIILLNPRFRSFNSNFKINKSELRATDFKKIKNKNATRTNTRIMLWVSAIELIKENPIIGIGAGGSHNRLYEVFAVKRQWYDKNEKYHAHNQYFQVLLDTGLLGFVPFTLLFIAFFYKGRNNVIRLFSYSFIIIIGINFLFESMFERYSGISFFVFFYCLFVSEFCASNIVFNEQIGNKNVP